jgi:hypothetical protein
MNQELITGDQKRKVELGVRLGKIRVNGKLMGVHLKFATWPREAPAC